MKTWIKNKMGKNKSIGLVLLVEFMKAESGMNGLSFKEDCVRFKSYTV